MKMFLAKTAAFLLLMCAADAAVGVACRFLQRRAKGGDTRDLNYIADRMEEELLVFGSSRAQYHYDPRILADSLGMTCYNCGMESQGVFYSYGAYRLFRDRYAPRVIVYDIYPAFDIEDREDDEVSLRFLSRIYDRDGIDSIVWDVDAGEKWKMLSMMRRYNKRFLYLVWDAYNPAQTHIQGYKPLSGTMDYEPEEEGGAEGLFRCDTVKMKYWRRLIAECRARGTRLVFAVSPEYNPHEPPSDFGPLRRLARKEGIPFLWHRDNPAFKGERRYFKDSMHLNKDGAEAYTRLVASELRKLLAPER